MNEQNIMPNTPKKFNLHKVFASIGIILIAIIIIGAGVWYFVQSAEDKVPSSDTEITVTKVSTDSAKTKTASNSATSSATTN